MSYILVGHYIQLAFNVVLSDDHVGINLYDVLNLEPECGIVLIRLTETGCEDL
jgi:hypothetical protein